MAELLHNNSFSWGDALFLYIERPGQPLSMACVSIFDGAIPLKACRDFVESKLPLIPRYRQHVAFPPFNLGLPSWQFDPHFDIRNHIRQVTLRHGTERQLKEVASNIVSTNLDRQRPLWDLTLVRGLEGGRTGMVARIHHCLADGVAGISIMNVLMDPAPVQHPAPGHKPRFEAPAKPDAGAQLLDSLVKSYFSAVKGALTLHSEALHIAQEAFANPNGPLVDLMNVVPEIATPAERLPFNVICHGPQKFEWTEIAMAEIQAVRQNCGGGTVNDVILTVMAAAIRRYAELHGVRVKGRSVRIMIPVNVRGNGSVNELGNQISFLPVTIPLDIRDSLKLFAVVRERMEYLKGAHAAEFVGFAGGLFATVPTAIWAAVGPVVSQLPLSLCNTIVTNIPGPQMPLYMLGRKMLSWYPYVPIGGELGLNCAILSYNGTAYFGLTCDVHAVPDPERLAKFVDISFAELRSGSSKLQPQQPKAEPTARPERKRPNATIPVAKKPAVKVATKSRAKTKDVSPEVSAVHIKKPAKRKAPAAGKTVAVPSGLRPVATSGPEITTPAPNAEEALEMVGA
ncbi:MAG: wax ester/triacylglycerol synthase family O-acyltransferase [Candidatus Korobacteraceae bacterium]